MNDRQPDFLVHRAGDSVGVAVRDLTPGDVVGGYLHGTETIASTAIADIPLGHKIAVIEISAGEDVIEYGERIGVAKADIAAGDHVHINNLRSARWQRSVA